MAATPAQVETLGNKKIENPAAKSTNWGRRLAKILFRTGVSVVVLLFFAQLIWKFSGSNKWEQVLEKDGIKVYSLKSPGSDLLQFKAIGRIHSTLPGIVAWLQDPNACLVQGCTESHILEQVGEQLQYDYFQYDWAPFGKRDFAISSQFYQNPNTKQVVMTVGAIPDRVPLKEGFFRVTNLNNRWRLTPLDNNQVEIQIENNMDPGGTVPTMMFNRRRPKGMYEILSHLEGWVNKEKYQTAKFDFIKEKTEASPTRISQARTTP